MIWFQKIQFIIVNGWEQHSSKIYGKQSDKPSFHLATSLDTEKPVTRTQTLMFQLESKTHVKKIYETVSYQTMAT